MTPSEVRSELVRALRLDLVGPAPEDEALQREGLAQPPSRWYLTGFLVPYEADVSQRQDEAANEQLDLAVASAGDDEDTPEPASARKAFLPSSLGISVLVAPKANGLQLEVTWGDYRFVEPDKENAPDEPPRWEREPRRAEMAVEVSKPTARPLTMDVPGSDGLRIVVSIRPVAEALTSSEAEGLPKGTRAVSVFLVNHRTPKEDRLKDEALAFQACLRVRCAEPFVARPNLRGVASDDWDEKVADLQYPTPASTASATGSPRGPSSRTVHAASLSRRGSRPRRWRRSSRPPSKASSCRWRRWPSWTAPKTRRPA